MAKMQELIDPSGKACPSLLMLLLVLVSLIAEGLPSSAIVSSVSGKGVGRRTVSTFAGIQINRQLNLPTLTFNNSMVGFTAEVGQEDVQFYDISGSGFTAGDTLFIEVSDASGSFTISNSASYSSTIEVISSDGSFDLTIAVKYSPTGTGGHTATINHSNAHISTQTITVEGNGGALPVEWLSFKARAMKGAIVLDWLTASEKYNSHFEVEISKNPVAGFEKIGRVNSKEGNSQSATRYSFAYYLEAAMGTYYFRLKQVDTDDAFEYSKVVAIEMVGAGGAGVQVAPNPIAPSSQLSMAVAETGELNVLILAMNGETVYSKTFVLETGQNKIQLHLNDKIVAGIYMLSTEFKGRFSRLKLIKE